MVVWKKMRFDLVEITKKIYIGTFRRKTLLWMQYNPPIHFNPRFYQSFFLHSSVHCIVHTALIVKKKTCHTKKAKYMHMRSERKKMIAQVVKKSLKNTMNVTTTQTSKKEIKMIK